MTGALAELGIELAARIDARYPATDVAHKREQLAVLRKAYKFLRELALEAERRER